MKRFLLFTVSFIFICQGFLTAESEEIQRVPVGVRAENIEERHAQLQKQEEQAVEEQNKLTKKGKKLKSKEASVARGLIWRDVYYTSHPAAYQRPISFSPYGESIELMDGSIWTVSPSDAYKALTWFPTDTLIVTPNHQWFSFYYYRLTNQKTGESVAVNLYLGPIDPMLHPLYTHWIIGIDYAYGMVYLEDGSIWDMSFFDSGIIDRWMVNDVVIIGVNDGSLSKQNPNILINVNTLTHARGVAKY